MSHFHTRLIPLLAVLAALCLMTPASAQGDKPPSLDTLVDLFVRIAGKPEYSASRTTGIHKWQKTVRYAVIGARDAALDARIDAHMDTMRTLTGLAIVRREPDGPGDVAARIVVAGPGRFHVDAPANADSDGAAVDFTNPTGTVRWTGNFFIFVGRREEIVSLVQGFASIRPDLAGKIARGAVACTSVLFFSTTPIAIGTAVVFIRTDVPASLIERCVEEEVTQSFGLMNDVRGSRLTLFDDDNAQGKTRLTEIDLLFLRVLYDPRIRQGMSGSALKSAVRAVLGGRRSR